MQTIKLKRKLRKSRKNNRMSKRDTMKRGGIKRKAQAAALEVVQEVVEQKKRSGRCSGIEKKKYKYSDTWKWFTSFSKLWVNTVFCCGNKRFCRKSNNI